MTALWGLGPAVRPGAVVLRAENLGRDTVSTSTVLAVAQNERIRIPMAYLAPRFRPGGGPHLGRMLWTQRLAGRGGIWGVSHYRPGEGVGTLEETIVDMQALHGPLEVMRAPDVAALVADDLARGDEERPGPLASDRWVERWGLA